MHASRGPRRGTIFERLLQSLRVQDWTAIAIELAIVVMGVFVGTLVANWNERRLETRETQRLLSQLQPELHELIEFFDGARAYYGTTQAYADAAFAGWESRPGTSDSQFVIAAYQASQVFGLPNNGGTWALIFGADRLRNIDDLDVRRSLARVMTANYADLDFRAVATPYREHVRQIIPADMQVAIRRACGDRTHPGRLAFLTLPRTCDLALDPARAAATAARLRARPELADELRGHLGAVATFMANMDQLEVNVRHLSKRVDEAR